MSFYRGLFLVLSISLTACRNEDLQPQLDIRGHWLVAHGFDRNCEVTATFTEKHFVLSFFDVEEEVCQPELYGITRNVLALQIVSRKDYFDGAGVLNTELRVSAPDHDVSGVIALAETGTGLSGTIVAAEDPNGWLEPLLGLTYVLTRESEDWLALARRTWEFKCDEVKCSQIQFIDAVSGRITSDNGGFTASDPRTGMGPGNGVDRIWTDVTFAQRRLNSHVVGAAYSMDLAIFPTVNPEEMSPIHMLLLEGEIMMTVPGQDGESVSFDLYPAD